MMTVPRAQPSIGLDLTSDRLQLDDFAAAFESPSDAEPSESEATPTEPSRQQTLEQLQEFRLLSERREDGVARAFGRAAGLLALVAIAAAVPIVLAIALFLAVLLAWLGLGSLAVLIALLGLLIEIVLVFGLGRRHPDASAEA